MTLTLTSPFAPPQTFTVYEGSSTFVKLTDWNGEAETFQVSVTQGNRCAPANRVTSSQEVSVRRSYGLVDVAEGAAGDALVGPRRRRPLAAYQVYERVADVSGKSATMRDPTVGKGKGRVDRAQRAGSDDGLEESPPNDLSDADISTLRMLSKQKSQPEAASNSNEDPFSAPITRSAARKTPTAARNTPSRSQPAKSNTPRRSKAKGVAKIDSYDKHSGLFWVKWKKGASRQDCWMHEGQLPEMMVAQHKYEMLHADVSEDAGVEAENTDLGDEDADADEEVEEEEKDDEDEDEYPIITPRGRKHKNVRTSMGSP